MKLKKKHKDFINENIDNVSKSQSMMDRFGLNDDFSKLPADILYLINKTDLKYKKSWPGLDGYGEHNYIGSYNDDYLEILIGVLRDHETEKFNKNSYISLDVKYIFSDGKGECTLQIVDEYSDKLSIINFLSNYEDIIKGLYDLYKDEEEDFIENGILEFSFIEIIINYLKKYNVEITKDFIFIDKF